MDALAAVWLAERYLSGGEVDLVFLPYQHDWGRGPAVDVVVDNLDPARGRPHFIDLVDPAGAEKLPDGTLRARRIGWDESLRLYGGKA